jgi:hypothetical protein
MGDGENKGSAVCVVLIRCGPKFLWRMRSPVRVRLNNKFPARNCSSTFTPRLNLRETPHRFAFDDGDEWQSIRIDSSSAVGERILDLETSLSRPFN